MQGRSVAENQFQVLAGETRWKRSARPPQPAQTETSWLESGAAFGPALNQVAGFTQPFERGFWQKFDGPIFVAAHNLREFGSEHLKVYLRRDFEAVWRSTSKAQKEMGGCWWGGTREECFEKWSKHVAEGCTAARLVIDYEVTRTNPATTVKAICAAIGYQVDDADIAAAVRAGSRENMLAEQTLNCPGRDWDIINTQPPTDP